ncbi:SAM-dependent methyltransferase [Parasphingorhabdus pacifica]
MHSRPSWQPVRANLERPSDARVYDYFLGGSSNFAVDREFARQALETFPGIREYARLNRLFLQRVVRFYADQGIRQFLDIGSGIPTVGAVHEIAQQIAPESRVVYVDNEAIAIAHSQLVLQDNPNATIVQGDLRAPDQLLNTPELAALIDPKEPVGILMLSMLHFVTDDHELANLLDRYRKLVAPGSYLALSHGTGAEHSEVSALADLYEKTSEPVRLRDRHQLRELLAGFEVLDPGIVFTPECRPDSQEDIGEFPERSVCYAAVGRKPESNS